MYELLIFGKRKGVEQNNNVVITPKRRLNAVVTCNGVTIALCYETRTGALDLQPTLLCLA